MLVGVCVFSLIDVPHPNSETFSVHEQRPGRGFNKGGDRGRGR